MMMMCAFAAGAVASTSAVAASLDALSGAWTMQGTDCAKTFEKAGAEVRFKDRRASVTTGIIVTGNKIVGPIAVCTADRVREENDHLSVLLSCLDDIMFSSRSLAIKLINQTQFE